MKFRDSVNVIPKPANTANLMRFSGQGIFCLTEKLSIDEMKPIASYFQGVSTLPIYVIAFIGYTAKSCTLNIRV